ncbi:MAG: hypothetical protein ACRD1L_07510, partial [Terriglobales bacterium]
MPMVLTGIGNENDFYSPDYLAALLEGDLKGLFERWRAAEAATGAAMPPAAIGATAGSWQHLQTELDALRDPGERRAAQHTWLANFLHRLGYTIAPVEAPVEEGALLRLAASVDTAAGRPAIWIIETEPPPRHPEETPSPLEQPLPLVAPPGGQPGEEVTVEDGLDTYIFSLPEPPRWLLLCHAATIVLVDRSKWPQRRLLSFDLAQILTRKDPGALRATAALLHAGSLYARDSVCLLDALDENSHRHAFAVSEDLKYAAREAIELLGNEVVYYLREVRKERIFNRDLAADLNRQCLRWLYRILFVLYVEARPELHYVDMKSDEYRTGYSFEALRQLEDMPLLTEESRNGYYLDDSLKTLFRLIWQGFKPSATQLELDAADGGTTHTFRLRALPGELFDPDRTKLLTQVRLRNQVLQQVIRLVSLSRPKGHHSPGRISYAQLGINQLGAVYEGLLSYTGFFAEQDLYEVKQAGEEVNQLEQAFFVPASARDQYHQDEKVFDQNGHWKHYPPGTFIYRLAGREREKSASYYTPESLTRCVVKYALKELLQGKPADQILELAICEPALGSGAFLNEAINQLADAYLERKQQELGQTITAADMPEERQKVKAHLATHAAFGADRNPVAIELAQVSLWLNTLHAQQAIPWFGDRLVAGNSLVGARRQVFDRAQLGPDRAWLDAAPQAVPMAAPRPAESVWHFLLPDAGMAAYADQAVKEIAPAHLAALKAWKKRFTAPLAPAEFETLLRLSTAAERLWQRHVAELRGVRDRTRQNVAFFPHAGAPLNRAAMTNAERDRIWRDKILSIGTGQSSPYRRLQLAMDYWCALWFWPIEQSALLPARDQFLLDLSTILEGTRAAAALIEAEQPALFADDLQRQRQLEEIDEYGFVDAEKLCDNLPRLQRVASIAERRRFLHWELE